MKRAEVGMFVEVEVYCHQNGYTNITHPGIIKEIYIGKTGKRCARIVDIETMMVVYATVDSLKEDKGIMKRAEHFLSKAPLSEYEKGKHCWLSYMVENGYVKDMQEG